MTRYLPLSALTLVSATAISTAQVAPRVVTVSAATSSARFGIGDAGLFTPGLAWQFGIHLQPRGSRLALSVSNWFYDESFEEGSRSSRRQALAYGIDLRYDLGLGRTRSYLVLGAGTTKLWASPTLRWGLLTPEWRGKSDYGSFGVGLSRKTGPLWLFGEARYTQFLNSGTFGSHTLPMSFGLRF